MIKFKQIINGSLNIVAPIFTSPGKKAELDIWSLNHDSKLKSNNHSPTQIMSSSF